MQGGRKADSQGDILRAQVSKSPRPAGCGVACYRMQSTWPRHVGIPPTSRTQVLPPPHHTRAPIPRPSPCGCRVSSSSTVVTVARQRNLGVTDQQLVQLRKVSAASTRRHLLWEACGVFWVALPASSLRSA